MRTSGEDWETHDKATLSRLWPTPLSASEIGAALSKPRKKNAVIGMACRMKLGAKPRKPPKVKPLKVPATTIKRLKAPKHKAVPKPKPEPAATARRAPMGLKCKWPIGDPSSDEFRFCGAQPKDGPYCVDHAKVAYDPPSPRRATQPARVYTRTRH